MYIIICLAYMGSHAALHKYMLKTYIAISTSMFFFFFNFSCSLPLNVYTMYCIYKTQLINCHNDITLSTLYCLLKLKVVSHDEYIDYCCYM